MPFPISPRNKQLCRIWIRLSSDYVVKW